MEAHLFYPYCPNGNPTTTCYTCAKHLENHTRITVDAANLMERQMEGAAFAQVAKVFQIWRNRKDVTIEGRSYYDQTARRRGTAIA